MASVKYLKYLSDFDYLIWIDADILIMNSEIQLEQFIEKYENFDIICGSDWKMINTGVLFIKNTEFSKEFLQKVYDNEFDPEEDKHQRYLNWEQVSFINLNDLNYMDCKNRIHVTDPIEFNSYWFNYFHLIFIRWLRFAIVIMSFRDIGSLSLSNAIAFIFNSVLFRCLILVFQTALTNAGRMFVFTKN